MGVRYRPLPGVKFDAIELDGYVAIALESMPLDVTAPHSGVTLATYSTVNGVLFSARGHVDPNWTKALQRAYERTFESDGRLVTVTRSRRWDSGSIASISMSGLDKRIRDIALILVPIGLLAGALLAAAVIYLGRQQLALPALIRAAMRRGELYVEYQPIIDLQTGSWCGAEALIRWQRSNGERVPPDLFVPIAEQAGLGRLLTQHVLELVAADARHLFAEYPGFHLNVNLTPADLHAPETADVMRAFLRATNANRSNLAAEATERDVLNPEQARPVVHGLHEIGVRVIIDDFGTGYSSLAYLGSFEFDGIKIDKSFVETIGKDAATSNVVFQIIRMANELGYTMTAEGVETAEQAKILRDAGVHYAQGWYYAKSLPFHELVAGFAAQPPPPEQAPAVADAVT